MINKKNRAGTSQDEKLFTALQPEYVSVEERSIADLLKFAREYANEVRFYNNQNLHDSSWTSFLNFTDDEIVELAEFVENPNIFSDDPKRFSKYSKPHLAVLLVFLKLLQYPKEKFAQLTEKKVAFFYRNVLKLEERAEVSDQVHVIFKLARDVREHLLTKGTLLRAGKDDTGADLHYEVTEDIVLNNAELTDIKTIHFMKTTTDIKSVHLSYERGDAGFERILCLALGVPDLPPYQTTQGNTIAVDGKYLRTELYQRIKGKEKDELVAGDANYIFNSLCFRFLKDFQYCLDLYYREMNRGYVGVTYPEDWEWEKAYTILEMVHTEMHARSRRLQLKDIHKKLGFESMMEFAFGEPEPGNMLYKMPGVISTLEELADAKNEATRKYIENKLCMTADDFKVVMAKKDTALHSMSGDEVYTLLETAWTKKRGYQYPEIGAEKIIGYYADSIFSADQNETIGRFQTFGKAAQTESSEPIQMGFAVSSPLLNLNEGTRTIEIVISCKEGTIDYEKISSLLVNNSCFFTTRLSVNNGWQQADTVDFEIGKFIIKPELKAYHRKNSYLVCDTLKYPLFDAVSIGKYLVFANCKVYKIVQFDKDNTRIFLKSVYLEFPVAACQLIKKLTPKTFVAELRESIVIPDEYAQTVSSSKETFDEYYCGKYLVDTTGKIFMITRFISASEVAVKYCGSITPTASGTVSEDDRLIINKVWETIEPQYEEIDANNDIGSLAISGIYSAESEFIFEVTDGILKIAYPEGATAENLIDAWKAWKDNPLHQPGRYLIQETGRTLWNLAPVSGELEKTGEIIKRYESPAEQGIQVTCRCRPSDDAYLAIEKPSEIEEYTNFLIAGDTLTITPGRVSQSANQIAADWQAWAAENDSKGYQLKSKDDHIWEAVPVSETDLILTGQQIKKCEICNLYGVGIRVLYTGFETDLPTLILKENTIDLFEFQVQEGPKLTIKYPSVSVTSANDLVETWREWKASELNNPGNFDIEQMGDGLWTISARTERDLKSSENQVIECTIEKTGIIARFKQSADYQNAIIEFVNILDTPEELKLELELEPTRFNFRFSDCDDTVHHLAAKKLTIYYPPLPLNDDEAIQAEYQVRHVQELLSKWNREYQKQGFMLLRIADNVKWDKDFDDTLSVNFMDHLNHISTVDPNGFTVKFCPELVEPYTKLPKAKVVIHENDTDKFGFDLTNDYPNNLKYLFIKYPTDRKKRTVEKLLKAWRNEDSTLLEPGSLYWKTDSNQKPVGELREFQLEQSGTGQWEIAGISEMELNSDVTAETEYTDPVNQNFFEYKTGDVRGFTIRYAGPKGVTPKVAFEENEEDTFAITVSHFYDDFFNLSIGESLEIKYPKRVDKRTVVELLVAWNNYKKSEGYKIDILGFEITDISLIIDKRSKSRLLNTGDVIQEYRTGTGDGLSISYIGHRDDPTFEMTPLSDFTQDVAGKKILWDNGEIFTITNILDRNNVTIEKDTQSIQYFDAIKLYENDAICLEALKFTIRLDEDFPPVIPAIEDRFLTYPAVKILLNNTVANNQGNNDAIFYDYFKSIVMHRIDIKVAAQGLKDIKLRGNIAMINPANPFQPFGITPDVPARCYFANREICTKKLDSLHVNIDWMENEFITADGLPDMTRYYYAYSRFGFENAGTIKNEDFEVKLQFLDRRTWTPISETPRILFSKMLSYQDFSHQSYQGDLYPEGKETPKDPLDWARYYKLELSNQGFMKDLYGDLMNELTRATNSVTVAENTYKAIKQEIKAREEQVKAAKISEAEANGTSFSPPVIPEARELPLMPENDQDIINLALYLPYTPVIRSMSIDYTASAKILLDTGSLPLGSTEIPVQLFRFHPFGYEEMGEPDGVNLQTRGDEFLLPQYNEQGYLFLGIKNLAPLQSVSLLFQMVSGSGDVNLAMPGISWSYLSANQWIPFKQSEILMDKTFGLQDTGVIRFNIPAEATSSNTILPGNRCWVRAAAPDNIAAVPDILDIKAGSICVTYRNQNNDPNHLAKPLVTNAITELAERDPAIQEVIQPYTSFNGKRREAGIDFYIRVSERLKHKNRALTLDDYEKLILTQFPQVYKVKCVPQGERALINGELLAPEARGEVIVIVILKNSNSKPFFPLKPKTPANILAEIKRYIQTYMPPLVNITVKNPRFEEIRYRLAVKFKEGYDQGYYINILNEDIKRFLSPWAYDKKSEISFGSSVYSSAVINYIENTAYVDYVANFGLLQQIIQHENYTETIPLFLTDDNAATAKYPDSILVSAESHIIDVITTDLYDPGAFQGIGHMKIETDFWISRPGPVFAMGIGDMEIEAWPILKYIFANVPVTLNTVTATVRGTSYVAHSFSTWFAREDSQQIWNALREAEYIDNQGNVLSNKDLNADDFQFTLQDGMSFESYLVNHFSDFIFQIKAANFDPSADKWDEFSCQKDEILNIAEIKDAVLDILRTGLSFDGRSQYPFMVY